jgi:N6-adenosine-specific RNA methylase IME4
VRCICAIPGESDVCPVCHPKKYRTIIADPPWPYGDKISMTQTPRGAEANYDTMSVQDICQLGDPKSGTLAGFAIDDPAFLFLWTTNGFLVDGYSLDVARAWGFKPKQLITWVKGKLTIERMDQDGTMEPMLKTRMGMGRITRGVTEQLLVCTKGKYTSLVQAHNVKNFIVWPEEGEVLVAPAGDHSVKPEASYQLVERLAPGPYLELFARQRRLGWYGWGKEYPEA